MSETTINYSATLTTTSCWCGIHLAIPSDLYRQARDNGQSVYCPLGHQFLWTETTLDRERKRAEQLERNLTFARQRADAERDLREHTEHKLRAQKGATTKAKKRHAAALCPCCNRSFVQLARHMEAKHPGYDPAAPDA